MSWNVWPGVLAGELLLALVTGEPLKAAVIMAVDNGLDAALAVGAIGTGRWATHGPPPPVTLIFIFPLLVWASASALPPCFGADDEKRRAQQATGSVSSRRPPRTARGVARET